MTRPTARLPTESPATRTSQVFRPLSIGRARPDGPAAGRRPTTGRQRAKGGLGTARPARRSSTPATTTENHHPQ